MTRYDLALEEWLLACEAEKQWHPSHGPLGPIMSRRDAATRELHASDNPWESCVCPLCSGRGE